MMHDAVEMNIVEKHLFPRETMVFVMVGWFSSAFNVLEATLVIAYSTNKRVA